MNSFVQVPSTSGILGDAGEIGKLLVGIGLVMFGVTGASAVFLFLGFRLRSQREKEQLQRDRDLIRAFQKLEVAAKEMRDLREGR